MGSQHKSRTYEICGCGDGQHAAIPTNMSTLPHHRILHCMPRYMHVLLCLVQYKHFDTCSYIFNDFTLVFPLFVTFGVVWFDFKMPDGFSDSFSGLELSNDQVPAQSDRNMACFDYFKVCIFFVKFPGSNFFPKINKKSQKIADFDVEIH